LVGYGRLEGSGAAAVLDELHLKARLYVNFFLPCFKLKSKTREGARVSKRYETPATPFERLLAHQQIADTQKAALRTTFNSLDPVRLLSDIRSLQHRLVTLEVINSNGPVAATESSLDQFVDSLSTAWKAGEARPTHRKAKTGPRAWRTRVDPFEKTWSVVERWLDEQPDANAKELLQRLQESDPTIADSHLRTLQRRVRAWRTVVARRLVVGAFTAEEPVTQKEEVKA
jgi:hypothetical protein